MASSPTPPNSVIVNSLWSASLVLSLTTASFGILIKQSLHKLSAHGGDDPHEQVNILTFRHIGFTKWCLVWVSTVLPHLLQIALVLFFAGLGISLHGLNSVVGWAATGIMIGWVICILFVNLAPFIIEYFPYMSFRDLLWRMESSVQERIKADFKSSIAVISYAADMIPTVSLRQIFVECLRDFDVLCNPEIHNYIAALAKGKMPEDLPLRWFPYGVTHNRAVSEVFLRFIQNYSDVKDLGGLDASEEIDESVPALLTKDDLIKWDDFYQSLVFTVKTACKDSLAGGDAPLHLGQLALLRHSRGTATMAMLSFYDVISNLIKEENSALVWWHKLELADAPELDSGEYSTKPTLDQLLVIRDNPKLISSK